MTYSFAMVAGLLAAFAGSLLFYLASPNQRWRTMPLPARPARIAGVIFFAAGIAILLAAMQTATAIFIFCVWLMLLWIVYPYLGALFSSVDKAR